MRTILIIAIIFLALRIFRMYIAPYLMRKGVEKMNERMRNHAESQFNQYQNQRHRPEGEVTVEKRNSQKSTESYDQGEYVEYEEIE